MKISLLINNDIHCKTALKLISEDLEEHEIKIILPKNPKNLPNIPHEIIAMRELEKCEIEREFSVCQDINSAEALADFKKFSPDLIISIRFPQIIKNADLISLPRFGILNLHSGILPNYRGIMASFWTILRGGKNLGTTLHYISDSSIDTGDIIGFSSSEIDWNSSLILNINKLYQGGCELIVQALEKISAGEKIKTVNQKTLGEGAYFSYPKQDDVKNFIRLMRLF